MTATEFGQVVRRLMTERGLSLRALAKATNFDPAYLSRAINGRQRPSALLAGKLDTVLGAHGAITALSAAPAPCRLELAGDAWGRGDAAALAALLAEGAAGIDETNAVQLAHEWLVTDPPQLVELRAGRQIGAELVAQVEHRIVGVRRLDDFVGGGDLADVAERELRATAQLLAGAAYTDRLGRRLLVAVGELAQLAGWVYSDAGEHAAAARFYLAGVRAAHAADDQALAANLLSSLSYQTANTGHAREAVLLARSAYRGAERVATPRTMALLADRVAWAHTKAGQAAEAERALGAADDALAATGPGDEDPDWVYWVNRDELDIMAGRCFTELRRPLRAEPLLRSVIARYDGTHVREVALYLTWLADTYAHAGEIDQAAATAAHALDLSVQVNSARGRERVAAVREHLAEWRGAAAVHAFEDHYLELLTPDGPGAER